MTPRFPSNNGSDVRWSNPESLRDHRPALVSRKSANLRDLIGRHLSDSARECRIYHVLAPGSPLKIAGAVVCLVSIDMIDFVAAVRAMAECGSNQAMQRDHSSVACATAQPHNSVTATIARTIHKSVRHGPLSCNSSLDLTKVRDGVKTVGFRDGFPYFHSDEVYHNLFAGGPA